jgi:hypothetical protein
MARKEVRLDAFIDETDGLSSAQTLRLRGILTKFLDSDVHADNQIICFLDCAWRTVVDPFPHFRRDEEKIINVNKLKSGQRVEDFQEAIVKAMWPRERYEKIPKGIRFEYTIERQGVMDTTVFLFVVNKWNELVFLTRSNEDKL